MTRVMFDRTELTQADPNTVFAWCDEHFGDDWHWDHHWPEKYCFFRFAQEQHAMLFLLKWKTN